MNPILPLRRVALSAAVAGAALAAVPALASASPCTYDPVHKVASVVDASGVNQLRVGVANNLIFTQDGGNPPANCAGAMTTNTDRINVFAAAKGASDGVVLDESKGAFAPGATPEADGNSEIELALNGQSGHLSVFGTPGDDVMRVRLASRAPANSALGFGLDDDDDVTFAASDVSLAGGDGADFLSGQGYGFEGIPATLPVGFSGGAGDDVIFGGQGVDHFAGNAGNDTLHTTDGNAELVNGGPDVDNAVRDGADTLSNVESSVFGSVGTLALAPRTVTADAHKWARMTLRWTHPKSWRKLRKLEVKLYRGAKLAGTIDVRPRSRRLSAHGVGIMANRSLVTRSAKTVAAQLGMKFPSSLAGASLRVAVQATDRDGHTQLERDAGQIRVAAAAALPRTCVKNGVCFTKTFNGANTKLTVTGTPGDDSIVLAHVKPFSNNTPSGSVSVNGKDAHVTEGAGLTLVVNGLAGNDHITEQFPTTTSALYGTSTLDGGEGDDTIAAAFRADVLIGGPGADVLDGGAGNDQLLARDGERDLLHGGLGTDVAQSDLPGVDTIDGVETIDASGG